MKTVAKKVIDINDVKVQKDIDNMLETLLKTPHCGGLAATQLDIKDPYYIFVFFDDDANSTPICAVNAEILEMQGEIFEDEGCMSVYPNHIRASVTRPKKTKIKYLDRYGKEHELERGGYLAKLFVHETDHLNGKVYIDHLSSLKRSMVDKKIMKVIKGNKLRELE